MTEEEIKKLAIQFHDQITDGDGYTHNKEEIEVLVKAGYIEPMKKRNHYMITNKLWDIL